MALWPALVVAPALAVSLAGPLSLADLPPPAALPADLLRLADQSQAAAALARQGEVAVAAGQLERAVELYRQAGAAAVRNGFTRRRQCELLLALGRRDDALVACRQAVQDGGAVPDLRAEVRALMAGAGPPPVDQVIDALIMAEGAQHLAPGQPWGYAALADIARRIGDQEMMRMNLLQLNRYAPGHHETRRALALGPSPLRWWLRGLGWAALLLASVLAAWRTVRRGRGRPGRRQPRPSTAARAITVPVLILMAAWPGAARAQQENSETPPRDRFSVYPIDDADPRRSIPTAEQAGANPLQFGYWLMDVATRAEMAEKRNDYRAAIKYYQALAGAVPHRAVSYAKICRAHEVLRERDQALETCRVALGKEGARTDDYSRYVRLLMDHPGPLPAAEIAEVKEIVAHLGKDPATRGGSHDVQCQLGVRLDDRKLLESCVAGLVVLAPSDGRTVSYQWALAVARRDFTEARRLVDRARLVGIKAEGIAQMEQGIAIQEARGRLPLWLGAIAAVLALGLLLFRGGWPRAVGRLTRKAA
jgi:tetratricopeptide (TPR) repeat protein